MKRAGKQVRVFNYNGNKIRTLDHRGVVCFVGKDVTAALGYSNGRDALARHVSADEKDRVEIRDTIGREQKTVVISKAGLNSLISASSLSSAKEFKRWVASVVLSGTSGEAAATMSTAEHHLQSMLAVFEQQLESIRRDVNEMKSHPAGCYSIAGYASLRGIHVDVNHANILGRQAEKLSRQYGYDIAKTTDLGHGSFNVYHEDILKEVFE